MAAEETQRDLKRKRQGSERHRLVAVHPAMTIAEAFERATQVRDQWLTAKSKDSLRQVYNKVGSYFGGSTVLSSLTKEDVLMWRFDMLDETTGGVRAPSCQPAPSTIGCRCSPSCSMQQVFRATR